MTSESFKNFDPDRVPSPCFVIDESALENNLKILQYLEQQSGAKVLLSLKAFAMFQTAPLINRYLSGISCSGLHETRLAYEEFDGEVHCYSVAYKESTLEDIVNMADTIVFNSFSQWRQYQPLVRQALESRPQLQFGLRINPSHSEASHALYDPCSEGSRLGITLNKFNVKSNAGALNFISGFHFHTLCEQGFKPLARTLDAIEEKFGKWLHSLKWINFGGGHHITAHDYDIEALIARIIDFKKKYDLEVYLEPGEAVAINTGVLVTEVLDIIQNEGQVAIVDSSATCHIPDTLEMPYQAAIIGAAISKPLSDSKDTPASDQSSSITQGHQYRIGGVSCLAGDLMGEYTFAKPLGIGHRIMFDDMAHYTMVKTNTFNGVALPDLAVWNSESDELTMVKEFSYTDFKNRLS